VTTDTDPNRDRRAAILAAAIILLVSFGVYANTLSHGFVHDDHKQIVSNSWITDVRHLPAIFTHDVWGFWPEQGSSSYYRPLMHVINLAIYQVVGLSPWAYHLVNVLLHAGTSVLVFFLALRLFGSPGMGTFPRQSFIAALLFATHPIHTEAVAWAGSIPELSFTFLLLLSFYLYLRSTEPLRISSPALYTLSLLSFSLAVICKEPALVLPVILAAYDYSFRRLSLRESLRRYSPYVAIAGSYLVVRFAVIGGLTGRGEHGGASDAAWLINAPFLFARYLQKLILPLDLNVFYSFHPLTSVFEPRGVFGVMVSCIFIAGLYVALRRSRLAFLSLVIIAAPLLPALYIPAIGGTPFGERYLYLPSFGFVLLLTLALSRTSLRMRRGTLAALAAGVFLAGLYSAGTIARNRIWKDNLSLWSDAVRKSPDSDIPYNNLGRAYFNWGDFDKAIEQYRMSLDLNPRHVEAHNNLGAALASKGLLTEAEGHFLTALQLRPIYSDAHNNLGILHGSRGDLNRAVFHFQNALRSRPDFADAHHNLGVTYMSLGSADLAIEQFQAALELAPDAVNTHLNLAGAYESTGLAEEARKHRAQAQALSSDSAVSPR
jgi:tetratricopeptide (TPR) repeat protein